MYFPLQDIRVAKQLIWTDKGCPVYIFKHDPADEISCDTKTHVQRFSKEHPSVECYVLDVAANPLICAFIAQATKIPHNTPQVIILSTGKTSVLNSREITYSRMEEDL